VIGRQTVPVAARAGVLLSWLLCALGLVFGSPAVVTAGVVALLAVPVIFLVTLLVESLAGRILPTAMAVAVLLGSLAASLTAKLLGVT